MASKYIMETQTLNAHGVGKRNGKNRVPTTPNHAEGILIGGWNVTTTLPSVND